MDGGADALLEAGYRPDLIVGDMDSVSDKALNCGAEIVVHAYPNGYAPGLPRVQDLGLESVLCPAPGTSEDVAVLLADEKGASLIVQVGMRFTLVEFLDKGRSGMASAVLTRIRVGDKIVDAKGVSRLYRNRISGWALVVLALAAVVTIVVAIRFNPVGHDLPPADRRAAGHFLVLADWTHLVIDFRYHLVSIVAVFLALAVGIVVGSSALQPGVIRALRAASTHEKKQIDSLLQQQRALKQQVSADQIFAQASASRLLPGLLAGENVVLVDAPGADSQTISGITASVEQAGAKITGQIRLQQSFFDTSGSTENSLNQLAEQLAPPGLDLGSQAANPKLAGQETAAQVITSALVASSSSTWSQAESQMILSGFGQQGYLQVSNAGADGGTALSAPAALAVVIIPSTPAAQRRRSRQSRSCRRRPAAAVGEPRRRGRRVAGRVGAGQRDRRDRQLRVHPADDRRQRERGDRADHRGPGPP